MNAFNDRGETVPTTLRPGPALGLVTQLALLVVLSRTVGLGVAGWVTGVACGVILVAGLGLGMSATGTDSLGPADWVTTGRAALAGCVAALTADSLFRAEPLAPLVAIATVALILDAVDGYVARRTGTASALGARMDGEVDAFLILVLSVFVARSFGVWVIAIGAMRYAFLVAGWVAPWLRGRLPFRYWRKVVTATQGIVLVVASANVIAAPIAAIAIAGALVMLAECFGRDVAWLWERRRAYALAQR
jgi:phosphatidylglycerophosphate synthase